MVEGPRVGRRLLDGWKAIAGRFGFVQTLVVLALFYAFILGPPAIAIAIARRDLLRKRGLRASDSAWLPADTSTPDFERAKLLS